MNTDYQSQFEAEFREVLEHPTPQDLEHEVRFRPLSPLMEKILVQMHLTGGCLLRHTSIITSFENPCYVPERDVRKSEFTFMAPLMTLKALYRRGYVDIAEWPSKDKMDGNPTKIVLTEEGKHAADYLIRRSRDLFAYLSLELESEKRLDPTDKSYERKRLAMADELLSVEESGGKLVSWALNHGHFVPDGEQHSFEPVMVLKFNRALFLSACGLLERVEAKDGDFLKVSAYGMDFVRAIVNKKPLPKRQ